MLQEAASDTGTRGRRTVSVGDELVLAVSYLAVTTIAAVVVVALAALISEALRK